MWLERRITTILMRCRSWRDTKVDETRKFFFFGCIVPPDITVQNIRNILHRDISRYNLEQNCSTCSFSESWNAQFEVTTSKKICVCVCVFSCVSFRSFGFWEDGHITSWDSSNHLWIPHLPLDFFFVFLTNWIVYIVSHRKQSWSYDSWKVLKPAWCIKNKNKNKKGESLVEVYFRLDWSGVLC